MCMELLLHVAARMYDGSVDNDEVGNGQRQIRIIAFRSSRECGGLPTVCHRSDRMAGAKLAKMFGSSSSLLEAIVTIVQNNNDDCRKHSSGEICTSKMGIRDSYSR